DGSFVYIPDEHFNGTETFSYTAGDGNGGLATATVTITVVAQGDAPIAGNDARATLIDSPLSVAAPGLLVNDYDVDHESLTVNTTPTIPPSNGTVTLGADGSYLYTPGAGYVGTDVFTYEVADPGGSTATATVTITVDSGTANQVFYFANSGTFSWDYDLTTTPPAASTPPFDSDGDGDPGLTIDKGNGQETEFNPDKFQLWTTTAVSAIELDGPVVLDLWSTVEDYDLNKKGHPYVYLYDCLGFSCTKLAEAHVHIDPWDVGVPDFVNHQIDLGSVTHTVAPGRDLVVRLQFRHEDMWVAMSAAYPTSLNTTLANQSPIALDDTLTVDEDATATNLAVLANDSDADIDTASVTITSPASNGTAVPVGDGTVDYTPTADVNGGDSFDYQVCDLGGNCATATVAVTINAVNDQPSFLGGGNVTGTIAPNSFPGWATAITLGPADESGQILTFSVTANSNPGLFVSGPSVDPVTGELTFDGAGSGTANITIVATDDGGTANGGNDTSNTYSFDITIP
ncbi:MAG: Ig-like domain-containing protein, partial [Acidimicrobiales bacterium]